MSYKLELSDFAYTLVDTGFLDENELVQNDNYNNIYLPIYLGNSERFKRA